MAKKILFMIVWLIIAPFYFSFGVVFTSIKWHVFPFQYGAGSPFFFVLKCMEHGFVNIWND